MDEVEPEPKPGKYPSLDDILRDEPEPQFLLPCSICQKTFNPESLQRHTKICEKNATRKRKQFDSFKQRVQGTGMAEFLSLAPVKKEKPTSPKKSVNSWKEKHEAFVSAIRAARGTDTTVCKPNLSASGDSRTPSRPSDHEQCPHCGRSFGPKAFDRHMEWCREHKQRQPPSVASQQARERLEARIKYRAPPCKSKRSLMREKYSPLAQRKVRDQSPGSPSIMSSSLNNTGLTNLTVTNMTKSFSAGSQKSQPPEPPVRYNRNASSTSRTQVKDSASNQGLNRGGISRTSIRASQRAAQRSVSPKKPATPASTKTPKTPPSTYRPSSRASNRRSDESLDLLLSTNEEPSDLNNASYPPKKKERTNESSFLQSPPQIIHKIETDRSRRNSAQRPQETVPRETPSEQFPLSSHTQRSPTTSIGRKTLNNSRCEVAIIPDLKSARESSSERPSFAESGTPYLLSDSDDTLVNKIVPKPVSVFTYPSTFKKEQKRRPTRKVTRRFQRMNSKIDQLICRKRRRVCTPVPLCVNVYQRVDKDDVSHWDFGEENKVLLGDGDGIDLNKSADGDFDLDSSSEDDFRGKRTSCSASTYTKDRSSFVDGIPRKSSSDLSDFSPNGKMETSPKATRKSSRIAVSARNASKSCEESKSVGRKKCRKAAMEKKTMKNVGKAGSSRRNISPDSRSLSPDVSPRCRPFVKAVPLKLPPVQKVRTRVSPERKINRSAFSRPDQLQASVITTTVLPAPVLRIKNKIPRKLLPLRKIVPINVAWR